ncbi:MAG: Hsp70 family protein [Acidimicrobiales bacterium]
MMVTMFERVQAIVAERSGGAPEHVVATYPANWGQYRLSLFEDALRPVAAGELSVLPEPVAAAVHYAAQERVEDGTRLAVYDLGGGTFDTAVLEKSGGSWVQLGEAAGIERLGGVDFDEALYQMTVDRLGIDVASLDQDDPVVLAALARLRTDVVEAKEQLSEATSATVSSLIPGYASEVRLNRSEFEAAIRPAIDRSVDALAATIERVGATGIDRVLLVGASSRIPLVAAAVGGRTGLPIAVDTHPKHAVALGAAISPYLAEASEPPDPSAGAEASDPTSDPTQLPLPPVLPPPAPPSSRPLPRTRTPPR